MQIGKNNTTSEVQSTSIYYTVVKQFCREIVMQHLDTSYKHTFHISCYTNESHFNSNEI